MSCCDPSGADPKNLGPDEELLKCPGCREEVVYNSKYKDYNSPSICNYSPLCCGICGCRDCDQSC